ncbi:MAG TPA: aldose epimerase family protein [Nocardioidaceae bacterium]|nr:aldose epimerase family protein [Nocardioidaceae bacterium]
MTSLAVNSIEEATFGTTADGTEVNRFRLRNGDLELAVVTWGAVVQSLRVPDRDGHLSDVVLGYDTLDGYVQDTANLGAVVGRFANRIARGRFTLDGVEYQVPCNDRGNALHGGPEGFNRQVWSGKAVESKDAVAVELTHVSADGHMGFPGRLSVTVRYTVGPSSVTIDYTAATDKPTVLNLTQHTYFNLQGPENGTIESHVLSIPASRYLPVDETGIPLGPPVPVHRTPFDFRSPKPVGRDLRAGTVQLASSKGYDHSLLIDGRHGKHLARAARVEDPTSGRALEVLTDQPAVQLYTGNLLDGSIIGKGQRTYRQSDGLCLETQHLPDSPNRQTYPSVVLRPGEEWRSTTVWQCF